MVADWDTTSAQKDVKSVVLVNVGAVLQDGRGIGWIWVVIQYVGMDYGWATSSATMLILTFSMDVYYADSSALQIAWYVPFKDSAWAA